MHPKPFSAEEDHALISERLAGFVKDLCAAVATVLFTAGMLIAITVFLP